MQTSLHVRRTARERGACACDARLPPCSGCPSGHRGAHVDGTGCRHAQGAHVDGTGCRHAQERVWMGQAAAMLRAAHVDGTVCRHAQERVWMGPALRLRARQSLISPPIADVHPISVRRPIDGSRRALVEEDGRRCSSNSTRTRMAAAVASGGAAKVRLWARSHLCLACAPECALCARVAGPSSRSTFEFGLGSWLYFSLASVSTRPRVVVMRCNRAEDRERCARAPSRRRHMMTGSSSGQGPPAH